MLNGPGFLAAVTFFGRAWPGSPLQRRGGSAPSNNGYRQVRQAAVNRKPSALTNQAGNLRSVLAISLHDASPDRHCLPERLEDARGDAVDTADTGNLPDFRRTGVAGGGPSAV